MSVCGQRQTPPIVEHVTVNICYVDVLSLCILLEEDVSGNHGALRYTADNTRKKEADARKFL